MKKQYHSTIKILFTFVFLLSVTLNLSSQNITEVNRIAESWLNKSCSDSEDKNEIENILKHKDDLAVKFQQIIKNGVDPKLVNEVSTSAGKVYDQNIKLLDENKPAWVTPEYEAKIRSVSKSQYIANQTNMYSLNYTSQAVKGLEIIATTTGAPEFTNLIKLKSYPNPVANKKVTIEYALDKKESSSSIVIFDQTGRKLIEKNNDVQSSGVHKIEIEVGNLPSGTYFYQLRTTSNTITKTFVINN